MTPSTHVLTTDFHPLPRRPLSPSPAPPFIVSLESTPPSTQSPLHTHTPDMTLCLIWQIQPLPLQNVSAPLGIRNVGTSHNAPHVHKPPSLESNLGQAHPLPAPQVGPTGAHEMVSMSHVEICAVQAPVRPRAKRGTQTEEGRRRLAADRQRKKRGNKKARLEEDRDD